MSQRQRYTSEQYEWLMANRHAHTQRELTELFNDTFGEDRTVTSIHSFFTNRGIKTGRAKPRRDRRIFTDDQARQLAEQYARMDRHELAKWARRTFGLPVTEQQVTSFISNHRREYGFTASSSGKFVKGQARVLGSGAKAANKTSFKPGQMPQNTRPLWSERVCNKDGYILIKVPEPNPYTTAATRWLHKHIWVYRQHNGEIPDDHAVVFLDGDTRNFDPANLEAIHRRVLVRLNKLGWKQAAPEARPALMAIAKLQAAAGERRRQETA